MSKLLRTLVAGYGANKASARLGGGCLTTIIIFILLWIVLGYFGIFQ